MDAENRATERPRYVIRTARQAIEEQAPVDWVVEGLLSVGSVGVMFGGPGTKKTYVALHLALSVTMGQEWLGHKVEQGAVLVIDEESGRQRLDRRIAQAMRGLEAPLDVPLRYTSLAGFNLTDGSDQTEVAKAVGEVQPRLVVIDALIDVAPGDENSTKDIQPVMQALRYIAETYRCAILIIHHSTKTGKTYRGSSAIKAAADLMLLVESKDQSGRVEFSTDKNRDGEPFEFAALATWTPDDSTFTLSLATPRACLKEPTESYNTSQEYVLHFLSSSGPSTMAEIEQHAHDCSGGAARQAVYALRDRDVVRRTNGGGKGVMAIWEVVANNNGDLPHLSELSNLSLKRDR